MNNPLTKLFFGGTIMNVSRAQNLTNQKIQGDEQVNTHKEHQPEPGSLDEALENKYERRKKELELEKQFKEELLKLLGEERFTRAHRILHSGAIGVQYAQAFIGLMLHATHLPNKTGISRELRDPAEADELIDKIFYELESFIEDPRSEEWLERRKEGDEWKLKPLEKLFQRIHRRVLHDVPVVGLD